MAGSALRNFRIFRDLCGSDCFPRITLCTTFWDLYNGNYDLPNQRLEELRSSEFWGEAMSRGSKVVKAPYDEASARFLFFSITNPKALVMQIQREVVDEGMDLNDTTVMLGFLDMEPKRQQEEHANKMKQARKQWEEELKEREAAREKEMKEMRKQIEAELTKQRKAAQAAEANLKRRMSEQADQKKSMLKQMEDLKLKRAQTDLSKHVEHAAAIRKRSSNAFNNQVTSTMQFLTEGVAAGKVKCGWNALKLYNTLVCTNCLMNIGLSPYYGKIAQVSIPAYGSVANTQQIACHAQAKSHLCSVFVATTALQYFVILQTTRSPPWSGSRILAR
jgi:hypothetical protein